MNQKPLIFVSLPPPLSSLSPFPLPPSPPLFLPSPSPPQLDSTSNLPRSSTKDKNPLLGSVSVLRVRENGKLKIPST